MTLERKVELLLLNSTLDSLIVDDIILKKELFGISVDSVKILERRKELIEEFLEPYTVHSISKET